MGTVNELDRVARANGAFVDALYQRYLADPASVDERWAIYFAGFELGSKGASPGAASSGANGNGDGHGEALHAVAATGAPAGTFSLVMTFRNLGHYIAKLDPLGGNAESHPLIDEAVARFQPEEMDVVVEGAGGLRGIERASVREIFARCRATYCGTIAVQYAQIADKAQRDWIQERVEPTLNRPALSREDRIEVLRQLVAAEEFEQFLHHKYVGAKRFSIEGADAVIPLLDAVVEESADSGVRELVVGMAHRGRLNVLAHTLRKPLESVLSEFEGKYHPGDKIGDGDVKYHMGFSHDHVTRRGKAIHLSLSPNPSHLEHVNPVIEGIVRAKQDRRLDHERTSVVPLLIHGDAAFTGQGIVAETLSLSELKAYRTGGTIHVIIDNRVGFTASPDEYRFTPYASDIARLIQAPVFHVNGDDPEAAVQAARLALAFRQEFKKDVIIDVICYRRHGHNETDDPTFTQPIMYRKIAAHPTARRQYERRLIDDGVLSPEAAEALAREAKERLEAAQTIARRDGPKQQTVSSLAGAWQGLTRAAKDWSVDTRVPRATLEMIARKACEVPEGFHLHGKVKRLYEQRMRSAVEPGATLDWGTAEMLAFGSLLLEGTGVRLAGQDAGRGTFTHRHAVWTDSETGREHMPLAHLAAKQARFCAIDTMLSEEGIFGFELGYSWADPWTLGIWEAQFGDFANVAQAMIDVFLIAGETKWQRMSGMVLLLPHGYEGQGPEHSSARLERFLQLSAKDNIQVVNLTTPAQYFHALRRQMRRSFRKPLVVMSPKSLLRHPEVISTTDDLASGGFETVKDEAKPLERSKVRKVLLTCGRLYYALTKAREERKAHDVAIVRVEQLYPFPGDEVLATLARYPAGAKLAWAQDEPWNMGAWLFLEARLRPLLAGRALEYVGRCEAASTATGSAKAHEEEERSILAKAFA